MKKVFVIFMFFIFIFSMTTVRAEPITTTSVVTTTYTMSGVLYTDTLTITTTLQSTPVQTPTTITTATTAVTTTEDVYKQLYSAMLRISYLEDVTKMQKSSINSLLVENSSLKAQNSSYILSLSSALATLNALSSTVSSLQYQNAALSGQLEYYKSNYSALFTAVAVNFNELNSATSFYSSVQIKEEAAKRKNLAFGIAFFLAIVTSAWLYSRYIRYKTFKGKKKRPF